MKKTVIGECELYLGNCREVMLEIQRSGKTIDALICDPPYGIGENNIKSASRGKKFGGKAKEKASSVTYAKDYGAFSWDEKTCQEEIDLARQITKHHAIFGGNYYQLPPTSCWLVWDKENGDTDFADCELCWTNWKKAVRLRRHLWNGMLRKNQEQRWHPTQKPIGIMQWVIGLCPPHETIIDPFAGAFTTGVAAVLAGKRFIGIEQDERYYRVGIQRIEQAYQDQSLLALAEKKTVNKSRELFIVE